MRVRLPILATALFLACGLARAEDPSEPNCSDPLSQSDMNICASLDLEKADDALNAQYRKTLAQVKDFDTDGTIGTAQALQKAQRAWIAFRDSECDFAGLAAAGGTMQPMLVYGCRTELTKARTRQLKEHFEAF